MSYIIFPGRHLLNTRFQASYLQQVLSRPVNQLEWKGARVPTFDDSFNQVIFAVTSANQANSRYNPIPFYARAIGVDRFAHEIQHVQPFRYRIIGIPHYAPTQHFASHLLKEVAYQTEGNLKLTPDNCAVICSTVGVTTLFKSLGFTILPAEAGLVAGENPPKTPIQLLQQIVGCGEDWPDDPSVEERLAPSTRQLWLDFPDIPRRVLRLWRDPLLNVDGDLTGSRDYASYASLMSNSEIISLKFADVRELIVPGKIVDEGCGDGALLVPVARAFPDSDLIGLDITGEFIARGRERQRAGEYGQTFIHFHQRNITEPLFEDNSIDTTLCNSTLHELWSYGRQAETVHNYLANKFRQTRPGGRIIIRDVIGPTDKGRLVYLWLNDQDGQNKNIFDKPTDLKTLKRLLDSLSSHARFQRFAAEFLDDMRHSSKRSDNTAIDHAYKTINGRRYFLLSLKDASEYLTKKDYTNNWYSELNEEFTFWDFNQWKTALRQAGFTIIEDPNEPERGSRVYTNPWIVENRWRGKAELYEMIGGQLERIAYPPTTIILVGQKPGPDPGII